MSGNPFVGMFDFCLLKRKLIPLYRLLLQTVPEAMYRAVEDIMG